MTAYNAYITPRVKRYGIVLGSALMLLALIFATSQRRQPSDHNDPNSILPTIDFTGVPPKELTLNRISADLEQLHQQQQALHDQHRQQVEQLQQELQQLRQNASAPASGNTTVIEAPQHSEPLPVDVLNWNSYTTLPSSADSEPDHLATPPSPPRPIRALGAAIPADVTPDNTARAAEAVATSGRQHSVRPADHRTGRTHWTRRTTGAVPGADPHQSLSHSAQPPSQQCP